MSITKNTRTGRKPYMVAVVLGAALAALGSTEKLAAAELSDKALGGISRYCSACWRNARLPVDRWNDCTQEVFARLLERVPMSGWEQVLAGEGEERREFLRAIDTVKKRHQRERARTSSLSEPVADTRDQRDRAGAEQREALAACGGPGPQRTPAAHLAHDLRGPRRRRHRLGAGHRAGARQRREVQGDSETAGVLRAAPGDGGRVIPKPPRNPKSEYRNPKQIRNPNDRNHCGLSVVSDFEFRASDLFRISIFGFRISDFLAASAQRHRRSDRRTRRTLGATRQHHVIRRDQAVLLANLPDDVRMR